MATIEREHAKLAPESDPTQRTAWSLELQVERERVKGMTHTRVADKIRKADDRVDRAFLYMLQQADEDGTLDGLGLTGDPTTRTEVRKALREWEAARVPK